jgi:predicted metal-dependent peptidase
MKQSRIGLRIVAAHEAGHAIYMHPQRRGSRLPKLWNIAVDYLVNGMVMEDFKVRNFNAPEMFQKHLGNFIKLEDYANMLRDPWNNKGPNGEVEPSDLVKEAWRKQAEGMKKDLKEGKLPSMDDDRELTDEEKKALEDYDNKVKCFFADPNLNEDMKNPEKIYDYFYSLLPKCQSCGRVGVYKKPEQEKDQPEQQGDTPGGKGKKNKNKKDQSQDQSKGQGDCQGCDDQNHNHDKEEDSCGCPDCGEGYDIFGFGDTLDEHMDTEESEEKLAKRMSEAIEAAKKMAGHVPGAMEDELGKLTEPKITWTDVIRGQISRSRAGNDRNDWTRFRSRPLFAGLMAPKRKNYQASFACLVDCSGSMSKDDISFGLSQLKALDSRSEGVLVPADAEIYYDRAVKIRACNDEELLKFKPVGRGGTMFADFFNDYEKELGKQDFLIVISDGYLIDTDIAAMRDPGVKVFWIITSSYNFNAPFGKVMSLK